MKQCAMILILCMMAAATRAQKVTRSFNGVSMSAALKSIEDAQDKYTINFIYDELEDYKVSTHIAGATVLNAVRQVIGFYPIRLTVSDRYIFVEPTVKTDTKLSGQIVDAQGRPVPFANVSLLSVADSSFLGGGVSNEAGQFVIPSRAHSVVARFSCVGYRTVTRTVRIGPIGTVRMHEETVQIAGVKKVGIRPTTRLTPAGFATDVAGTLLAHTGTARDLLRHIPRVTVTGDAIEVFGKGAPVIYVDGRKLADQSELTRLNAADIKNVEVVTAPGAEYDAEARSVIRIKMIRRQDNGLSGRLVSRYTNSKYNSWMEQASVNYRHDELDIFGSALFSENRSWNSQVVHAQQAGNRHRIEKVQASDMYIKQAYAQGKAGFNYQVDEKNSFGATYSIGKSMPHPDILARQHYDVTTDGRYTGSVDFMDRRNRASEGPVHEANVYYAGTMGKVSLNFDGTALWKKSFMEQDAEERSQTFEDRNIKTENTRHSNMLAAKLVASYPTGAHASLTAGTEYTYSKSHAVNINQQQILPSSDDNIVEDNIAAFASMKFAWGVWSLDAGLRYEHVDYRYYAYDVFQADVSRQYSNFFPNLSLAYSDKGFHSSLALSVKTARPKYHQLTNFQQYDDRYLLEGGNPLLQPEKMYDVEWNAQYRWLTLSANYTCHKNKVMYSARLYDTTSDIVSSTPMNIDLKHTFNASITASPVVGFWHPVLELDFFKQIFDAQRYGSSVALQRPEWGMSLNNSMVLPRRWTVGIDCTAHTSSDSDFTRWASTHQLDLSLTKLFFKGALVMRLDALDVFNTDRPNNFDYFGRVFSFQKVTKPNSRSIMLTAQVHLYPVRSKYKGTGAGSAEKQRL